MQRVTEHTRHRPSNLVQRHHRQVTGFIVGLLLATGGVALAEEVFTPRHLTKLRSVLSAEISPDGQHVAYTLSVPRDPQVEDGPAHVELHVVDREANSRSFLSGDVSVSQVAWSSDSRTIYFVSKLNDDKHSSLYAVPADGGEPQRVLTHGSNLSGPALSPDGAQVAFLATEPVPQAEQDLKDKGFNQEIYEEDWRPTKVWIAPLDGSQAARPLDLPGSASDVQWNPQTRELAVVLAPTPLVDDSYMFRRVHVVDADTGRVVENIANPGKLGVVHWSPDGNRLAMISGEDIQDPAEGRLMVADVPGDGQLRDLMPDYEAHVSAFTWLDADKILWLADEGTGTVLGTMQVDGGGKEIWLEGKDPVLAGLSWSDDAEAAVMLGHTAQHPPEVFFHTPSQEAPQRLTDSNPWLSGLKFARQETITWNARDGLELQGVLVYPLNYREGRTYPLIMAVHGGPEAHISDGWVTSYGRPGQVGAARGFAVFYPNYRGSTGRGVEFSKMGQADAAGKEFDDIVDGIDALVEMGIADPDKVGITGGSYGGYASAWGSTYYSDRYAASVMFVGISDNVSKVGTTDIPEEMFLVHHLKRLWDDWDYFLERSPIYHIKKNQTPTLILHGKADPRVHPSQSLEFHRHLKTLGQAPVRLVLYPGEGHGNRRAASRLDYNLRMLRWFEHYLQGPGGEAPDFRIDYAPHLGDD